MCKEYNDKIRHLTLSSKVVKKEKKICVKIHRINIVKTTPLVVGSFYLNYLTVVDAVTGVVVAD
jgi:hypothetical protein